MRTAQSPRSPPLAPTTGFQEAQAPGEAAEEFLRKKCPVGSLTKLSGNHKFPQRPKEGSPEERELDWPYHLPYQKMKKLPYKSATGPEIVYYDFLQPFTVASGNLHRGMMPGNVYPGEEGRAAEVAQGNDPPRSP
eukprot:1272324-Pyramimonas_sp.AAC.1